MAGLMITVLDANTIIAAMDANDTHHAKVASFLKSTTDDLRISKLSLAEALVAQVHAKRGVQAHAAIQLLGIQELPDNLVSALDLATTRDSTGLKMPDCVVLASARAARARLATTDARLATAASDAGIELVL